MRVAMVGLRAPWGTEGGVETSVAALAPRLARRGVTVSVCCRARYNTLGPGMHEGVELIDGPAIYTKHLEAISHTAMALPRVAANADVVHLHATGAALLAWLPRLAGVATVVTVHGLDWKRDKWGPVAKGVLRLGALAAQRLPDATIVVGDHLRTTMEEGARHPPVWIPNGVDPVPQVPLDEGGVVGLKPRQYLLFVGRLVPEKGLDDVVDAMQSHGSALPLVVVGGASYSGAWVARLKERAPASIHFVGPRFGRARDALLSNARAFVYPSRVEGFPIAPLEAMAAGTPVVLSDIPPHREILGDSGAGWLVSRSGWGEAFATVGAASIDALARRGEAGAARVQEHFGWDQVADRTLQVYETAIARARARHPAL